MAVTETTRRGWFARLGDSLKGIVVGIVFVVGGVGLLFWGEGRAVKRAKALDEGAATVISVPANAPQPANEGRLVHFSGRTESFETVRDPVFGVVADAVRLVRRVEMYQWRETKSSEERKTLGGGTETVTTYDYETTWSDRPIDSDSFKEPGGHENPEMPLLGETVVADPVVLGDWILSDVFVGQLDRQEPRPMADSDLAGVSTPWRDRLDVRDGGFYLPVGSDRAPQIGDVRISFQVVPHATVSVIGRQVTQSLMSYESRTGSRIHLLDYGTHPASAMFETAKKENTVLAWILRGVGFLLIFIGCAAILKPLSVLADVIPFLGNIVGAGATFIAFILAAIVSLITIALGWIVYRPLLGVTLLILVGVLLWWMMKKLRQSERAIHDKWTGKPTDVPPGPPGPPVPPPAPPPVPPVPRD